MTINADGVLALVALVAGAVLGPLLRAQILHFSVPNEESWRRDCPECGAALLPTTWRVLPPNGQCPRCRRRIGPAPGLVEAAAAATLALLAWRVSAPLPLAALCWAAVFGVVLAFVDVVVHRLPDRLTLPAAGGTAVLLGLSAVLDGEPRRYAVALASGLGLAAFYLVLALIAPAGMGLGDVKLALCVGLVAGWFGWQVAVLAAMAGFLMAGLYAAGLLVMGRVSRKDHVPHGPFMLLGALVAVILAA
ncbi:prepilin peptidase [Micromonospora sp. CPCC 206061]|uniref:prepilin peptidase n=1 Tax=Micromonospora sp. CPCC 206061 TaxID=3122410 RepID=UPI002FF40EA4